MPSFDVVSEVDKVELANAVANAKRELENRFDFRGVQSSIEHKDLVVTLKTESDFQVRQLEDLFRTQCAKRNVDAAAAEVDENPIHVGKTFSLNMTFREGIDQMVSKKIVKLIKSEKLKVQAAIQGDKVRVTGKKRDDLQECMALLRQSEEIDLPLQFNNFRD